MKKHFILIILLLNSTAKAQLAFTSLEDLLAYAVESSAAIQTGEQRSILAKWEKVAALGNAVNLKTPATFSATNNTQLQTNYLPAEAFGGAPGTFREVTFGQPYVNSFNFTPQIDLINLAAWQKVKSAALDQQLTTTNNLLNKRTLFESIAAAYYNVVSLQEQIALTQKTLAAAGTLLQTIINKHRQGLVRQQDVNEAQVNYLNVKEKLAQLEISRQQQINSIKILCDISAATTLALEPPAEYGSESTVALQATSLLTFQNYLLQKQYAQSEVKASRWAYLPTLSLVFNQSWQQSSESFALFDNDVAWRPSQYIGLRLSIPLPLEINKYAQQKIVQTNARLAALNLEHAKLQNELNNRQLDLDYERALSQCRTSQQIAELKADSYQKSLHQFEAGILAVDKLLLAFTEMLSSRLNYSSALSQQEFAKAKIDINNSVK